MEIKVSVPSDERALFNGGSFAELSPMSEPVVLSLASSDGDETGEWRPDSRGQGVEAKAKARPCRGQGQGQGHDFLSSRCPRGRGAVLEDPIPGEQVTQTSRYKRGLTTRNHNQSISSFCSFHAN